MTEPTMSFEQALNWAYSKRAIVRFFESNDTKAEHPTVRVTVVASNLEDRYQVVQAVAPGQSVQDALVEAIATVQAEYEANEADAVAKDRRAGLRAL